MTKVQLKQFITKEKLIFKIEDIIYTPQYLEHFWVKLFKMDAQLFKNFKLLESFYPNAELLHGPILKIKIVDYRHFHILNLLVSDPV